MNNNKTNKLVCSQCKKVIRHKQHLKCLRCKHIYDLKCANKEKLYYLMDTDRKNKWICDNCNRKKVTANTSATSTPGHSTPTLAIKQCKPQKELSEEPNPISDMSSSTPINTESVPIDTSINHITDNVTYRNKSKAVIANVPTRNSFDSLQTDIDEYEDEENTCITPQKLNRSCPDILTKSHLDHEALQQKLDNLQQKYESAEQQIDLLLSENFYLKKKIEQYKSKLCNLTSMCKSTDQLSTSIKSKTDSIKKTFRNTNKNSINESFTTETLTLTPARKNKTRPTNLSKTKTEYVPRRKINIVSTNTRNKLLKLATTKFQHRYQLCHYKLPHRGILNMLESIEEKLSSFTKDDFCVLLIGEKDFETSQNYTELVKKIRNKLIPLNHTNLIICLPTFNCGRLAQLFNRRIEIFNKILYHDIQKHKYAYLLDSNRHLTYDYLMFNMRHGAINNKGMDNVLSNLKYLVEKIQTFTTDNDYYGSCDETYGSETFFRD
ncbi:hypothetical protein ABMA28_015135 [Loxostege sticticalis]|uniref:Uncharacterized protein n=2 Tax=Loxostege sticticalis TaxID=481309 RepID=A0ABD0TEF7_LOXSC